MVEHYQNLSLKSMFTLKFYLEKGHFKSNQVPEYLFKVDDDTFINLPALKNTISHNKPLGRKFRIEGYFSRKLMIWVFFRLQSLHTWFCSWSKEKTILANKDTSAKQTREERNFQMVVPSLHVRIL